MHVYAGDAADVKEPAHTAWVDIRNLIGKLSEIFLSLAGKASQLILWERTHAFCGQCGKQTTRRDHERARECKACKLLFFPKICPVVLALVQKNDEILLARPAHYAVEFYSALAGYVESGETLEQLYYAMKIERVCATKIERQNAMKNERQNATKIERQNAMKIERQNATKIESQSGTKPSMKTQ